MIGILTPEVADDHSTHETVLKIKLQILLQLSNSSCSETEDSEL
jgi:hypothetical protein